MAALITDKLRKKKSLFSTTLNGAISAVDTVATLVSTSGLPTDTAITITINRIDSNGTATPSLMETVTGIVSGSTITSMLRAEDGTTARTHATGSIVEMLWDAETWNDAVVAFLTEHNQDGTHAPVTITNILTSAGITLDQNGTTSASTSTGGAFLLENTGNTGAGLIVYSNAGASTGRLVNIRADNPLFDQAPLHIDNDGVGNAFEILHNSTGSSSLGLSLTSINPNDTALGVIGQELSKGTVKITHKYTGTSDANASCISMLISGTSAGTACQGLYIATDSGKPTTGKYINFNNDGVQIFAVTADGDIWSTGYSDARGFRQELKTKTVSDSPYTMLSRDHTILANATGGAMTINLPSAATFIRWVYVIKKIDSSSNAVTLDGNASETIDGATTYALTKQYDSVAIQSDGTNWHVINLQSAQLKAILALSPSNDDLIQRKSGVWTNRTVAQLLTDMNIVSGTYTPTLTGVANVAASTAYLCQYMRVGSVVTVSGKLDIDTTSTGATQLGISLPIASNIANPQNCAGTAAPSGVGEVGAILGDASNDRAELNYVAIDTSNHSLYFSFTYQII